MFSRIVVPLDGSECSDRAFDVALRLAKAEGAELRICSVVDPIVVGGTTPPSPALDLLLADRENEARRLVNDAVEKARREGLDADGEIELGVAFDAILRYAKREKAGVIVMGTHGRSGIKRLFLGSIAESVLREAPCPVIVVRESRAAKPAHQELAS